MESSTQDVYQYFQTQIGTKINDIIKLVIGPINKAFGDNYDSIKGNVESFGAMFDNQVMPVIKEMITDTADLAVNMSKDFDAQTIMTDLRAMTTLMDAVIKFFNGIDFIMKLIPAPLRAAVPGIGAFYAAPTIATDSAAAKGIVGSYTGYGGLNDVVNIPRHAEGGIVTRAQLGILGERGPEAIIPLSHQGVFDDLVTTLDNLNALLGYSGPGSFWHPGAGIGGSGLASTEYGPGVPGDQPGGPTYDSDSWHHIGHIHGVPYRLDNDSVAMHPAYAHKLGVQPHGWFKDPTTGQMKRWDDTTGSSNPSNIDHFKGAQINYSPTYHIQSLDSHGVKRVLEEHGHLIYKKLDELHQAHSSSNALA
jgi:hypothetical protein